MRFFKDAAFEFIEKRQKAYVVSAVVLAIGIGAMLFNVFSIGNWMNYGVDFTGGTVIQIQTEPGVTDADLREALGGPQAPSVTRFGADDEFIIRAPVVADMETDQVAAEIRQLLAAAPGIGEFEVVRTEIVGPVIGAELQQQAALAILFSFLLTLLYIAFRFEFRFGLASIAATLHDILVTLGFLALFRIEISLPTVAAVLTIIGYSLNDTIVVFDRIRENLNKKGGRREDPVTLIDRSINEVLPRTVMTSGTTLVVLLSLLVLGGAVIRDFTIVLILGVVIGTYSSIFVASPALLEIQRRWEKKEKKADRKKPGTRARDKRAIPV
ncbi:MAG: protein translocase subunit SecF [Gemmatimonadales bacterium]|nr:MAG: protein translocase subunit SecF [Gemmatimonadales bacterium]